MGDIPGHKLPYEPWCQFYLLNIQIQFNRFITGKCSACMYSQSFIYLIQFMTVAFRSPSSYQVFQDWCVIVLVKYNMKDIQFRLFLFSARVGLMHIGVFILLLLSGERNFGVRLNKPYTVRVPMDIPVFTGTHADFLIIVSLIFSCWFFLKLTITISQYIYL